MRQINRCSALCPIQNQIGVRRFNTRKIIKFIGLTETNESYWIRRTLNDCQSILANRIKNLATTLCKFLRRKVSRKERNILLSKDVERQQKNNQYKAETLIFFTHIFLLQIMFFRNNCMEFYHKKQRCVGE